MKRQIHAYRGAQRDRGGGGRMSTSSSVVAAFARSIFFVQTQQLIAGGRHPELREHARH